MNEDKGKSRATGDEDANNIQREEQQSFISRVAVSATGLTRSAFATPNGNELNERTAAALGEKGQVGQSSNSSSAWAQSSNASQKLHQANPSSAFRAGHDEEHVRQSENDFSSFLDGIDSFAASEDTGNSHFANGGSGDGLGEAWERSQPAPVLSFEKPMYGTIAEQQSRDGEDILALLSHSGTDEAFEPSPLDENQDWGLSAEQLQQLRAMTKDMFPPVEKHGAVDPDHPLNLVPTFDNTQSQSLAGGESWREQWDGVLNRYTDEVWGDLLPLVKEARKEFQDLGNDPSSVEQPKALRRLGAILGHLRKY